MAQIAPDIRATARRAQQTMEAVRRYAASLAAASGWAATMHPVLASLACASAFLGIRADAEADKQRRIADDPPRDDYKSQTYLATTRIHPELLLEGLASFPTSAPDDLIALGTALTRTSDTHSAMLRAFERAAGAFQAADETAAAARLRELSRFTALASRRLTEAAERTEVAAESLEEQADTPVIQTARIGSLDELLSDQLLACLYRAGVTIGELRSQRVSDTSLDPQSQLVDALRTSAPALAAMAVALAEWDSESDARKVERRIGRSTVFIEETELGFTWRFVGPGERLIARSEARFPTREAARANAQTLLDSAQDASIVDE